MEQQEQLARLEQKDNDEGESGVWDQEWREEREMLRRQRERRREQKREQCPGPVPTLSSESQRAIAAEGYDQQLNERAERIRKRRELERMQENCDKIGARKEVIEKKIVKRRESEIQRKVEDIEAEEGISEYCETMRFISAAVARENDALNEEARRRYEQQQAWEQETEEYLQELERLQIETTRLDPIVHDMNEGRERKAREIREQERARLQQAEAVAAEERERERTRRDKVLRRERLRLGEEQIVFTQRQQQRAQWKQGAFRRPRTGEQAHASISTRACSQTAYKTTSSNTEARARLGPNSGCANATAQAQAGDNRRAQTDTRGRAQVSSSGVRRQRESARDSGRRAAAGSDEYFRQHRQRMVRNHYAHVNRYGYTDFSEFDDSKQQDEQHQKKK